MTAPYRLIADDIVFHEHHVRIGISHGWLEEYRVHVNWEYDLTADEEYPVIAHISLSSEPADLPHDLLSAPSGSLPRMLGERLKTEMEGDANFIAAAREAGNRDMPRNTAADERREIQREYA